MAQHEFGSQGELLVIAHGLLGSSRNWQAHAKALSRDYAVVTVDMRNHGHSPWIEEMSYAAMAADLRSVIDKSGSAPVTLIGHSMGGKAAMLCALLYPELVRRLVIVDIAPVTYHHDFIDYIDAMLAVDVASTRRRADVDQALSTTIESPAIRSFLLQNLELSASSQGRWRPNLRGLRSAMDEISGWPDYLNGRSFAKPVLFIRGGLSDYVLDEHSELIEDLFRNATHASIPNATHWVHADAAKPFQEALVKFLSE